VIVVKKALFAAIVMLGLTVAVILTDHSVRQGNCAFCKAGNRALTACPLGR
jgi:hypothetical protein